MCTAYKVGKRGNVPAEAFFEQAVDYFMGVAVPRIVRPTHKAPVIMPDGAVRELTWGFRITVKGAAGKPITRTVVNSREDKLGGRTWSKAFAERRCLIPAFSFYEWINRGGKNVPLEFESVSDQMLWIAGIWSQDEKAGEVFSMITTEPNAIVAPVHDRMPAALTQSQIQPFLSGDLQVLGPSAAPLCFSEAENFLSKKKDPPIQGELL